MTLKYVYTIKNKFNIFIWNVKFFIFSPMWSSAFNIFYLRFFLKKTNIFVEGNNLN